MAVRKDFGIPIISVGNLVVGGSGKTPFTIAIAKELKDVAIISRGYGRKSKGLIEVSRKGMILTDVEHSGDEPMLVITSYSIHYTKLYEEGRGRLSVQLILRYIPMARVHP